MRNEQRQRYNPCKQPKRTPNFKSLKVNVSVRMAEHNQTKKQIVSIGEKVGNAFKPQPEKYVDPILQQRDNQARQVKHTIAPISNKGAYQVITNEADYKTVGRKV